MSVAPHGLAYGHLTFVCVAKFQKEKYIILCLVTGCLRRKRSQCIIIKSLNDHSHTFDIVP